MDRILLTSIGAGCAAILFADTEVAIVLRAGFLLPLAWLGVIEFDTLVAWANLYR